MLSLAPTRVKILSTRPMCALSAGTKHPICAIRVMRAVCRSKADLPAMFGPVIMMICCSSVSRYTSLAMYFSPGGNCFSITGWRPWRMSSTSSSTTFGRMYLLARATLANDSRQSRRAICVALIWMAGINSASSQTSSLYNLVSRIRILSSAPRIFSSYSFSSWVM